MQHKFKEGTAAKADEIKKLAEQILITVLQCGKRVEPPLYLPASFQKSACLNPILSEVPSTTHSHTYHPLIPFLGFLASASR
jgi:hypothetical protein